MCCSRMSVDCRRCARMPACGPAKTDWRRPRRPAGLTGPPPLLPLLPGLSGVIIDTRRVSPSSPPIVVGALAKLSLLGRALKEPWRPPCDESGPITSSLLDSLLPPPMLPRPSLCRSLLRPPRADSENMSRAKLDGGDGGGCSGPPCSSRLVGREPQTICVSSGSERDSERSTVQQHADRQHARWWHEAYTTRQPGRRGQGRGRAARVLRPRRREARAHTRACPGRGAPSYTAKRSCSFSPTAAPDAHMSARMKSR